MTIYADYQPIYLTDSNDKHQDQIIVDMIARYTAIAIGYKEWQTRLGIPDNQQEHMMNWFTERKRFYNSFEAFFMAHYKNHWEPEGDSVYVLLYKQSDIVIISNVNKQLLISKYNIDNNNNNYSLINLLIHINRKEAILNIENTDPNIRYMAKAILTECYNLYISKLTVADIDYGENTDWQKAGS